jgi:DNA-3-methyladenine glycosylase II
LSAHPKAAREPYEAPFPGAEFPLPQNVISAGFDALSAYGFSVTKIATIKVIAEATLSGLGPPLATATAMEEEDLISRIVTIKGIGRWTIEMLPMYSLEPPDVLPIDGFGIREGCRALKSLPSSPLRRRFAKSARRGHRIERSSPGISPHAA